MTGPDHHLNNKEIQYLSVLLGLMDSQNWKAFAYAILANTTVFRTFCRTISQSSELNGMTILHACVRHNPPSNIVKLLVELVPESPSCIDCLQRTPLHIAAGTRASLSVVKLLTDSHPGACTVQDEDGKTPLHLACDSACELFEGDGEFAREPPSYEVVKEFVKACPLSVPLEDQDGMSALEHAIFSDAPINVVKLLQYATRKQCESQQNRRISQELESPNIIRPKLDVSQPMMMNSLNLEPSSPAIVPARKGEYSRRKGL